MVERPDDAVAVRVKAAVPSALPCSAPKVMVWLPAVIVKL